MSTATHVGATKGGADAAPWKNTPGEKITIEEIVKSFDPEGTVKTVVGGYNIDFSDGKSLRLRWSMTLYHASWVIFVTSTPIIGYCIALMAKDWWLGWLTAGATSAVMWGAGIWAFRSWKDLTVQNRVVEALAETKQGKVTKLEHLAGLLEVLFALQRCPSWTRRGSLNPAKWWDHRNHLDREVTDRIVKILAYLYELNDKEVRQFGRQDLFDQQINLAEKKVRELLHLYWRRISWTATIMLNGSAIGAAMVTFWAIRLAVALWL